MTPIAAAESPGRFQASIITRLLARWLLLDAYGPRARRHMMVAWAALTCLAAVDMLWLQFSHLSFAPSNLDTLVRLGACMTFAFGFCGLVARRLAGETHPVGIGLREITRRIELFCNGAMVFSLLGVTVIVCCYLGAAAVLPLQDARLAQIDRAMGFDWVGLVGLTNSSALASWLLVKAYQSAAYVLGWTILWLCLSAQGERLAEFLAISCLTSVGIMIGMMILPAAGAYAYYDIPLSAYDKIGAGSGMWHHDLLMALRTGKATVIDFNTPNSNCLVTFPSGHTVLAVIMTYALRGSPWTFIPALLVNGIMMVSTVPHGGHHVFDLVVGAAIAVFAIILVRLPLRAQTSIPPARSGLGLAKV
jgi:membrane-associated phospholipid phosphatase